MTLGPDLKRVLLVILQPVVQQNAQRHYAAVELAVLGRPVWVDEDGGLVGEDVSPLPPLPLHLLLPFPLLLLTREGCCELEGEEVRGLRRCAALNCKLTSLSSSTRAGSSSSTTLLSSFSGSLDSSTCSSTFSCLVRRAISCDFKPFELRARQSSSLRRSFTCRGCMRKEKGSV